MQGTPAAEIVVLGNDDKPPKVYLEDDQPKGVLIDILKYLETHTAHDFVYELYPWKRAYNQALEGRGVIVGLSKTSERLTLFDYSEPIFFDELVLVVRRGNEFQFTGIPDLRGKIIGHQRGSSYGDAFEQAKGRVFTAQEDGSGRQRLLKLLAGRIDAALLGPGELGVAKVIDQDPKLRANRESFVVLEQPFAIDPNYIGFSKAFGQQAILDEINEAIRYGWNSGAMQSIIDAYGASAGSERGP